MKFDGNEGIKLLKEAFNEFAAKQTATIEKTLIGLEGVQAEIEALVQSGNPSPEELEAVIKGALVDALTQDDVENIVADVQELLAGEKTSTGISLLLSSFDASEMDQTIESLVSSLKDPQVAMQIAQGLKQSLNQPGQDDMGAALSAAASQLPLPEPFKMMVEMQADRFGSFLDNAKHMSEDEIANAVMGFADEIPTTMISQTLYGITASMSPEAVSQLLMSAAASLPTPQEAGQAYAALMGTSPKKADNDNTPKRGGGNGGFKFGGNKPK